MVQTRPIIVIVGGGAGGLELATDLGHRLGRKGRAQVILVDRNRNHMWKPLLHEVACGSLDTSLDGVSYSAHAMRHGYEFKLGEMCGLDQAEQTITLAPLCDDDGNALLPARTIRYDRLVLAFGSVSNDFGTPGVRDNCYLLDSLEEAELFQRNLINQLTQLDQRGDDAELRVAVVGAGATGVEFCAELHHVMAQAQNYGLTQRQHHALKIILIEAGPRAVPALAARISTSVEKRLAKLGIDVRTQTAVASVEPDGLLLASGEKIIADMMIWSAGVKVSDFVRELGNFELTPSNQINVKASLQSTRDDNIFVIGDAAAYITPEGVRVPPRAQSAHQMASTASKNIRASLRGRSMTPFVYRDYGSLVNLSRFSTVGSLMGNLSKHSWFVEGQIARLMYVSLYRMHQVAIHGYAKTAALWLGERLMRMIRPKMKLH